MRKLKFAAAVALGAAIISGGAFAQDFVDVIRARQGQFYILQYNLGVVEDMVANKLPYDRGTAIKRAENIQIAAHLNQDVNWLPGSDQPDVPRTVALSVRSDPEAFKHAFVSMMNSADRLKTVATTAPPSALGPAVADMRKSCAGCHQFYRTQ